MKIQCTTSIRRRTTRWEHEDVLERMQARLDRTPEASRLRRSTVEHTFGTLKAWMGATHFLTTKQKTSGATQFNPRNYAFSHGLDPKLNLNNGKSGHSAQPASTRYFAQSRCAHSEKLGQVRNRFALGKTAVSCLVKAFSPWSFAMSALKRTDQLFPGLDDLGNENERDLAALELA